ncbi:MAG TPA: fibronectin type III-like domain-contianing protein, partial [Prolixibacteraceae bacterium]|nr:fibronectin type III-like domain-contianing protein [Prolixibacteraceae bacterium]
TMDGTIEASCTITNTGEYTADEIVQLYVRDLFGSITRPVKELKGFDKITLEPGESKEVNFTISPDDLEFHNGEKYVIEPGDFHVWLAPNSAEGSHEEFKITE